MQQLTGVNGVVTQAGKIVSKTSQQLAPYTPLIINFVQLLSTLGAVFLLKKVGRKPLTLIGNIGLGFCDIILGILFFVNPFWAPAGILIIVMLVIYMIIYGLSLGPVVWLYVPQIIPAKVVPLATMMNWIGCSLCVIFMPIVIAKNNDNAYPVFFFFGVITILFFVFNVFAMIETKGRSTE